MSTTLNLMLYHTFNLNNPPTPLTTEVIWEKVFAICPAVFIIFVTSTDPSCVLN